MNNTTIKKEDMKIMKYTNRNCISPAIECWCIIQFKNRLLKNISIWFKEKEKWNLEFWCQNWSRAIDIEINNTFFFSAGADNAYRMAAANTLSLNQWVYISAVCQNGGGSINLYKNGIETSYGLTSLSTNTLTYTYPQFNVGFRDSAGTTDPYTGNISVVQIYNRALSAAEVLQNYNATKGRYI